MAEVVPVIASTPPPAPARDPITCHVLDLTTGSPAPHIPVSLTLIRPFGPSTPMTANTDADGRVNNWKAKEGPALSEIFHNLGEHEDGKMMWSLKFDTLSYFGEGKTFFPEVVVPFFVDVKQGHYHVPLLLGPYSYTTYRGS